MKHPFIILLALVGSVAMGQVPFDTNLRVYRDGDEWRYDYTSLLNGTTLRGRTRLVAVRNAGTMRQFNAIAEQIPRASTQWTTVRTTPVCQGLSGGPLYSGTTPSANAILLAGIWGRTTAFTHFPGGQFINPKIVLRNVGQQTITEAGRQWHCNVYRRDEGGGYLLAWFNTRCGNIVKHEAYLHGSPAPIFRVRLTWTNVL